MHAGIVQGFRPAVDPEEPGRLLKGLRAELWHLKELLPSGKAPVCLAVFHDVLRHRRADAGDIRKKRRGGGVEVNTHAVDAVLHNARQRVSQLLLIHVVLILTDADRPGIDLHQLRERILKAPSDRGCAALSHIELRELLTRKLARRIDRGSRLVHNDILQRYIFLRQLTDQLCDDLLRLPRRSAVAKRDKINMIGPDQAL